MPIRDDSVSIWQGDTTIIVFAIVDAEDAPYENLDSVDLVFHLQWTGGEIERLSTDAGVVVDDVAATATVTLSAEETAALNSGLRHRYDLRLIDGEEETTLVYGIATVSRWMQPDA